MIGSDRAPALPRSSPYAVSTALTPLASPNSPMKKPGEHAGHRRRSSGPARPCRPPWSCRRGSRTRQAPSARPAAILPAFAEAKGERTLRTSGSFETRATTSSIGGSEGRIARAKRVALDEDALTRRLLEPGVEDPIHAAGLARPRRVRVSVLRPHHPADGEGDHDEGQPAERRRLPVSGAPATHAGRQVGVMRFACHARSSSGRRGQHQRRYERALVQSSERSRIEARTSRMIRSPTQVGGLRARRRASRSTRSQAVLRTGPSAGLLGERETAGPGARPALRQPVAGRARNVSLAFAGKRSRSRRSPAMSSPSRVRFPPAAARRSW